MEETKRARVSSALLDDSPWVIKSVQVVCRSHSYLGSLSHVAHAIDSYMPYLVPWTLESASTAGHAKLLDRLAEQEYTGVSRYFREKRFEHAVRSFFETTNDQMSVLSWWMTVYYPTYGPLTLIPRLTQLAIDNNRLDVLIWLDEQGLLLALCLKNSAVTVPCKYPRIAYWLHEHARGIVHTLVLDDHCSHHEYLAFVKWAHDHRDEYEIDSMQNALHHAITHGQLELIQWIYEEDSNVRSTCDGFRIAIHNGQLEVAKWLYLIHPQGYFYDPTDGSSGLEMNTWLLCEYNWVDSTHRLIWIEKSFEKAASDNIKEAVELLYIYEPGSTTGTAMENAAAADHLEMIRFLHSQQAKCTKQAMDLAAAHNHFEVVQWLHRNRSEGCSTDAMDLAAANGHFEMVRWLYENRHEGCTVDAMDAAVKGGYFEIVQFLFEKGASVISGITVLNAALSNHLELFKWIHENGPAQLDATFTNVDDFCGVNWFVSHDGNGYNAWSAMDSAAATGHLQIVRYLYARAKKRCSPKAILEAAFQGHLNVVKWYYTLPGDKCKLLEDAAAGGNMEMVKFLMQNSETTWSARILERVANKNHFAILEWLLRHSQTQEITSIYLDL